MMSGMPLKHVEPSMNGGIINSNTRLHLVGYFYQVFLLNVTASVAAVITNTFHFAPHLQINLFTNVTL